MRFTVPPNGETQAPGGSWICAHDVEVNGRTLPFPVFVRLGYGADGKPIATGLLLGDEGQELTTRAAQVPLARVIAGFLAATTNPRTYKRLARELHGSERTPEEDAWQPDHLAESPLSRVVEFLGVPAEGPRALQHTPVARARPGRRGWPDDHWKAVASAYRKAKREHPGRHIQVLMEEFRAPESTVHRWIRTAKDKGFIKERPGAVAAPRGMSTEE